MAATLMLSPLPQYVANYMPVFSLVIPLPLSTVRRLLKKGLGMKPYRIELLPTITDKDKRLREQFCRTIILLIDWSVRMELYFLPCWTSKPSQRAIWGKKESPHCYGTRRTDVADSDLLNSITQKAFDDAVAYFGKSGHIGSFSGATFAEGP